jgi:hypothetical protein
MDSGEGRRLFGREVFVLEGEIGVLDRPSGSERYLERAVGRRPRNPDPKKAQRVMDAMLQMKKIDIARLEAAAGGQ